ncbi:MAG: DnaA regulatory inactivator Hda [Rubrivivax sp.]|nr:DnaA regulatory inactivator Hda [Rubrivivax sp.]
MRQLPLPIGSGAEPSFENFVAGRNAAALAHLAALRAPAAPVYLWGPAASGKTHLLRALARRLAAAGQQALWFDGRPDAPDLLPAGCALLAVDRCEALDASAQRSVFALFEQASAEGVAFAAAGRLPPVDLPLREDLRTRLAWGHVFALEPLGEAETRAALRREADRRGIFLSDDVMGHLLTRFPRDLAHLMALLDRLDEFALAKARPVTVPLLRLMLTEEGSVPAAQRRGDAAP